MALFDDGQYDFIAADVPWPHNNYGLAKHGAARAHYSLMKLPEICALPIELLARKNALLGLWCLGTKEAEGAHIEVAKAWGFEVRTRLFTWIKCYRKCLGCGHDWDAHEPSPWDVPGRCQHVRRRGLRQCECLSFSPKIHLGPGNYTGQNAEIMWLGVKGGGWSKARARKDVRSVIIAPLPTYDRSRRGKHSAKPSEAYRRIELLWPGIRRLELFRRGQPRPGWSAWGDECEGGIDLPTTKGKV